MKAGRFGPYVQLGELADGGPKPRTSSLFASMSPATLTFEEALDLLRIPRVVGTDPDGGRGDRRPQRQVRSLPQEGNRHPEPADRGPDPAASPSTRPWPCSHSPRPAGRAVKGPLREMGADPDTGLTMVVKDGRFGPYVTDGTTNASLRKGDDVESLTVERASELLAERRASGPAVKKSTARKAAKKATAKKGGAAKNCPGQEGPGQEGHRQKGPGQEGCGQTGSGHECWRVRIGT